mgnify:CR=1 FL=1
MKTDNMDITIDDIINTVKSYNPQANFDLITKAYNLAYEAHADQNVFQVKCISHTHYMLL